MSNNTHDLAQFYQFVGEQLQLPRNGLTSEECLDLWRAEHPSSEELAESILAIEEGMAQARRGEGMEVNQFMREFKRKRNISDDNV